MNNTSRNDIIYDYIIIDYISIYRNFIITNTNKITLLVLIIKLIITYHTYIRYTEKSFYSFESKLKNGEKLIIFETHIETAI